MLPTLFSVFLDYRCNFSCEHCSVGSSPKTIFPMERQLLLKLMEELKTIPSAQAVVFTGGEPTMRKQLLLEGISLAKQAGLMTRVVTNSWWAKSPEKAITMVRTLKRAGLDELNTSYDDFHAPFTGVVSVVNAVRAALDEGLRVCLGVVVDDNATFDAARVRRELADGIGCTVEELANRPVSIIEDYPTPTGSGAALDVRGLTGGSKLDVGCAQVMKVISVHPNGLVKVCCGHEMFYVDDLTVGNLSEEPLSVILERGTHSLLYWWVHMLGPKRILERLGVQGDYTNICHACGVLFREHKEELYNYLREHYDDVWVNDVLLSDSPKVTAQIAIEHKDRLLQAIGSK